MERDNAAVRTSFAGEVYEKGVICEKKKILSVLPEQYSILHQEGDIHIHDLESFGKTYNCCTPDWAEQLLSKHYVSQTSCGIIAEIFQHIELIISRLAAIQSGGIGFGNFDTDLSTVFQHKNIPFCTENINYLNDMIRNFIHKINQNYTRFCREPYYLTLNMGLAVDSWGRKITELVLKNFMEMPMEFTRPNIVFKVNKNINSAPESPNYDLFQLSCRCTGKRMIPTYLLTGSQANKTCIPEHVNIMGCRTRVYDNLNGESTTLGRGNISYVSINLPRISLKNSSIKAFYSELKEKMKICVQILEFRNQLFRKEGTAYISYILKNKIWKNVACPEDMLKQGSYSIGFIGLSETVEVLTGARPYQSQAAASLATEIVQYMRSFVDSVRAETRLNFALLATPGEMLSGRFCSLDKICFPHSIQDKNFYTNSFHANVDSGLTIIEKIQHEAVYHSLCNGGCITYLEFQEAPLENTLAFQDILEYAEKQGISYIGFNYPLDICRNCGTTGTFDFCPECGSADIKRIRRVSGYLEDVDGFTAGKKAEEKKRKANNRENMIDESN